MAEFIGDFKAKEKSGIPLLKSISGRTFWENGKTSEKFQMLFILNLSFNNHVWHFLLLKV